MQRVSRGRLTEPLMTQGRLADRFGLLLAFVILLVGGLIQSGTYLNHDVAWVLNSSERLLQGGTFGQDIVAANPPLIWWLSACVAWLANLLGSDPVTTLRAVVIVLAAGVLVILDQGLRTKLGHRSRAVFLVVLALLLTLGVHRDFAQREHLSVILCLPWLLVCMRRADGEPQAATAALLAGIAAGIGLAFKPHFLAAPALIWLYIAIRRRSVRPVLTIESAAIFLTCVAYLAAVWLFANPYLTEVIPLISQVYWGFDYPVMAVIESRLAFIAFAGLALIIAAFSGWRSGPTIPALAAMGFLIAALAQSKGYSYHLYPVLAFSLISLAFSALSCGSHRRMHLSAIALAAGLIFTSLQAGPALSYRSASGTYGQHTACLVGMTQTTVPPDGGFMAISTHPYPGFPIANYSGRTWVAATNSRIFLPVIARLRAEPTLTAKETDTLALAESSERAAMLRDMAHQPAFVMVDARPFRHAINALPMDFVSFYREDPAFAQLWTGYTEIPSCAPGIRTFQLSKDI